MTQPLQERQRLIEDHCYLCTRASRKFMRAGLDRRDLEQVAAIGLIKAADRFDPNAGTPFEAYAWVFVLGELMHYVRDTERLLRVPRRMRELERRWLAAERDLWMLLGREPKEAEIASIVGASSEDQRDLLRSKDASSVISVDALRPYEQRALSYTMDNQLDKLVIQGALARLSPLEREIVIEIYEKDTPLTELARRLGYSRRHLTRLHRNALQKLSPYARPQIA